RPNPGTRPVRLPGRAARAARTARAGRAGSTSFGRFGRAFDDFLTKNAPTTGASPAPPSKRLFCGIFPLQKSARGGEAGPPDRRPRSPRRCPGWASVITPLWYTGDIGFRSADQRFYTLAIALGSLFTPPLERSRPWRCK